MFDGDLTAFDRRFQPSGGGRQITFHVINLGLGDVLWVQGAGIQLRCRAQESAHAAFGVRRDQDHAAAGLTFGGLRVRQVGGHAMGQQVLAVKRTQFVSGHAARIKRFSPQLRQSHHGVSRRSTACAAGVQALHVFEQFSALRCADQGHVPLAHTHGAQQFIGDFVFGIDQGVANGIEVVMGHGGVRNCKNTEFSGRSHQAMLRHRQ